MSKPEFPIGTLLACHDYMAIILDFDPDYHYEYYSEKGGYTLLWINQPKRPPTPHYTPAQIRRNYKILFTPKTK